METEAQKAAKRRYLKQCKQINVVIYPTEGDIMDRINEMGNKTGYIKDLIRDDIALGQRETAYYEQTEDMTTGEVVQMARNVLEALGCYKLDPGVEESRRIVSRAMAARDDIIGGK